MGRAMVKGRRVCFLLGVWGIYCLGVRLGRRQLPSDRNESLKNSALTYSNGGSIAAAGLQLPGLRPPACGLRFCFTFKLPGQGGAHEENLPLSSGS